MSNYSGLKQDINNNIYENQTQQITGTVLNAILNEMTASLGAGYQFAGVATLGMNPGDPDQRVFYLAGEGIYTSFGGIQVPAGKLGVLKWDNRWTLQTIDGLGGGGANLTGYVSVASTDDLPDEGQPTLGYLCGTNLYLYVGEGGDTKEGKYQDCGSFRGPEGAYIQDIEQTETSHENGGRNTIKMTLSDGRSFNAYVHNGTTSSGLFPTVAALQAAYPNPVVGQYAFVGAGFPADIYVCTTAGTWTDSGEDYDGDNVDLTDYATKAEVNQLEAKVSVLDVEVETGTVSERIGYEQNIGYISSFNTIVSQTTGNNLYSGPILLKAGESLKINAITPTNVGRLASYNPDTQAVSTLLMGQSAGTTYPTDMYENTYTATNDIYVIVGWNYIGPLELTKTYDKTTTTSKLDELDDVEVILDIQRESGTSTSSASLTFNENEYLGFINVGRQCSRASNNNYETSADFNVKRGDIINVVASNVGTNVTLLAYKDGTAYRSIIGGANTTGQTASYTVPYDQVLAVCFNKSKGGSLTITRTESKVWSERLDDLEDTVNTLDTLPDRVEDVEDDVISTINDDFTVGAVSDKAVSVMGTITDSAGSKYKEFSIQRGASISAHVYTHTSIAAISQKMPNGKYVSLVSVTGFAWEDLTYTATEDMTIAICTYSSSNGATATIVTHLVESNRLNIVAIQQKNDSDEVRDIELGFLFNKIAVIGDSMSVATMDGYVGPLGASWLSFLAKRWESVGKEWYAKGGTTTYMWLNNTEYGLGKLLADETIYNCYFIAYGHNDSMDAGHATDEAAPVTITDGVPSCPDGLTFCAYYKAIINQIRTKAPHAMIFCLSQYDNAVTPGGWNQDNGQAVVDVAEWYYNNGDRLVHHLDTGGVPISGMDIGSHYSTIGYAYIAKRINDEANKVIYQHRADTEIKTFGVYNL